MEINTMEMKGVLLRYIHYIRKRTGDKGESGRQGKQRVTMWCQKGLVVTKIWKKTLFYADNSERFTVLTR